MRHAFAFLCLSVLALTGCDDGGAAVFADFQYSTRCNETGGCVGERQRDVCGFNMGDVCDAVPDAPSPSITCQVIETESTRTVSFVAASQGDDGAFSIGVAQMIVDFAGGAGGGPNCNVVVRNGANSYSGRCGSSPPSLEQPCQISSVMFLDDAGNPTLQGSVRCEMLSNSANPTLHLELSSRGSGMVAEMTPAQFRFVNCAGLQVDP